MTIENDPTPQSPLTQVESQYQGLTNVPHSGVHHDEKPHIEFDSTTLEEAHAQNLLKIPEDPSALAADKKHKRTLALIAGGAVLAAGGFFATQMGGSKDKPKTVTTAVNNTDPTADPSTQSTQPSAETPGLQLPDEGERQYIGEVPRMQLKDFTPTFGNETSSEVVMKNFLANYQTYNTMAFPEEVATTLKIQQLVFGPGSPELKKATRIGGDIFGWLTNHPTDAQYYTWQLEKVVNGSLDHHDDDSWIITADILIGNTNEIEHHSGAFRFQKVSVPFANQPIWALEIEYPKNAYSTPR